MTTRNNALSEEELLLNAALGLCGEAGEIADSVKKYRFQGHPLQKDEIIKELGDVLWYVALACDTLDISMDTVMRKNIAKLRARYPEGFSTERSIYRQEHNGQVMEYQQNSDGTAQWVRYTKES